MSTANYKDATNPFGCREITIGARVYEAESFEFSESARVLEITDHEDIPSGQISRRGFGQGTAVLQADAAATVPAIHEEFTATPEGTMFITDVAAPETKDGIKMYRISFRLKMTPPAEPPGEGGT